MVLCDQLIYNVPGTLTIEVVADETTYWNGSDDSEGYGLKSRTYAFSQTAFQDATVQSGADMWYMIYLCLSWFEIMVENNPGSSSAPHFCRMLTAISGHVAATRDGEEYDVIEAMAEYIGMIDTTGYTTHTYVFTFDRIGLRKDDIANAEDVTYLNTGIHLDGMTIKSVMYILFLLGFLDPVEAYQLLSILY